MSRTPTLAQRVLAHVYGLAKRSDMELHTLKVGWPFDHKPMTSFPPILPQDMKDFYAAVYGLGFDMESEDCRSGLNMTTWIHPGEGREMRTDFKHWGWVKPEEVLAGAPPPDGEPDDRWSKGIFFWNADARDPRPEEGSSIVLFEGSADSYFLCVEITKDERYKYFRRSNQGYLKPLPVQTFTELMELAMRWDFCEGWFEQDINEEAEPLPSVALRPTMAITVHAIDKLDEQAWKERLLIVADRNFDKFMERAGRPERMTDEPSVKVAAFDAAWQVAPETLDIWLSKIVSGISGTPRSLIGTLWNGPGTVLTVAFKRHYPMDMGIDEPTALKAMLAIPDLRSLPFCQVPYELGINADGIADHAVLPTIPVVDWIQDSFEDGERCYIYLPTALAEGMVKGSWEVSSLGAVRNFNK